jgi:glutamate carboxypeptidase
LGGGIQRDVMQKSDDTLEFIHDIEKISGEKLLTESRGGVSDANILSANGVITLDGFGPFGDGDHTVEERANKKSFDERIKLTTELLKYFTINLDFKGVK